MPVHAVTVAVRHAELAGIAIDSLRESVCVVDTHGVIALTNQAWNLSARLNGADLSRCGPGVNYLEVCCAAAGSCSQGALEAAGGIESVLRGRSAQFVLDYPCHSPSRNAWFRLVARPLRPSEYGAVLMHSDITTQIQVAEKLRRAQANYGALWGNPVHIATLLAVDGTIRYQSPASQDVLGIQPAEMEGRPVFDFIHPDDVEACRKLLRGCVQYPSRRRPAEYRFRNRDGAWRVLQVVASNLASHPGGGILLNSNDITDHKLAVKTLLARQDVLLRDRQDLEALTARLFRQQDEERRRVATELNGNLGQRLAGISLQAQHLVSPAAAHGQSFAIQENIAGLGRHLHDLGGSLYPATLAPLGLGVALRDYCAEFALKNGIPVNYVHRRVSARLPLPLASALYRIAEEALANVARHAHATQAWVALSGTAKGIKLAIRDDGAGFDPAADAHASDLGILAMRERLRAIKGSLSIRSRPGGAGTEIVALAPLTSAGYQASSAIARDVVVDPLS